MLDTEMQRCHCNVVVRCRRTSENGVDLPKGQKLFSFSTSICLFFSPLTLPRFYPFRIPFSLIFTYARAWQKGYRLSRKYLFF